MYGEEEKGNPGPSEGGDRESDVDVYGETFGAAADEAYEAVKRGDAAGFRTALKEAIMACMDM